MMLAWGAMTCAHSTSSDSSSDQVELVAVGSVVPPDLVQHLQSGSAAAVELRQAVGLLNVLASEMMFGS